MITLAVETASGCSIAVLRNGAVLAVRTHDEDRGQAELLVPFIGETLAAAGVSYADITRLAVGLGAGSFTGLRVGIATMRGLKLALNVPLYSYHHFALYAARVSARPLLVVLDTKRGDVYSAIVDAAGGYDMAVRDEETVKALGLPLAGNVLGADAGGDEPLAVTLARMAEADAGMPADANPLYLRPADVSMPTKAKGIKAV